VATKQAATQSKAPTMLVPFTRAAKEHYEPFFDTAYTLGATSQQIGPVDIPAYGFARGVWVEVVATGASGGSPSYLEDGPFSVLDEILYQDVNGANIYGSLSGHDTYLINKWGGYAGDLADPKSDPDYSAAAAGNFSFLLYVPLEVNGRDGLGALANQNAASTYKLRLTLAPSTKVYSATTPPTTLPSVRVRCWLDAWTQPTASDLRGNAQATQPPALGTTSYWSKTMINVPSGFQTLRLPRVGNYIREMIFVYRAASDGTRATGAANMPDPATIYWDTRTLKNFSRRMWRRQMSRRTGYTGTDDTAAALDKSVFVEDYAHEFNGRIGYELRDGWLPTSQSTRLEISGTFGAAGTLTVITNDVAPTDEIFI
jgi:hypothetical protein